MHARFRITLHVVLPISLPFGPAIRPEGRKIHVSRTHTCKAYFLTDNDVVGFVQLQFSISSIACDIMCMQIFDALDIAWDMSPLHECSLTMSRLLNERRMHHGSAMFDFGVFLRAVAKCG